MRQARSRRRAPCALALLAALGGCSDWRGFGSEHAIGDAQAAALTGGTPALGAAAIQAYGCGTCHTVRGVPGANALVGPPLNGIGERPYIAGVITNRPDHLVRWIRDPRGVDSLTAMPDLGVTDRDARDIAAYLYTLR